MKILMFGSVFQLEPEGGCCSVHSGPVAGEATDVIGRDYFARQAETLFQLAGSASDPLVAAALTERAIELQTLVDELCAAPDPIVSTQDIGLQSVSIS